MVNFYVAKIVNKEVNPKTGEVWKVEDVPKLWRAKVEAKLQELAPAEPAADENVAPSEA